MAKFRVTYRCPHCAHGFVRSAEKLAGGTSCPGCGKRFTRALGQVLGAGAGEVRKEDAARKYDRIKSHYGDRIGLAGRLAIRGEQVPRSRAEAEFKAKAAEKGWTPHRPSWPDFLVETPLGTIAVEVKSRTDRLSATQVQTFTLLEAIGLPVYIWKCSGENKHRLVRWNGGEAMKKVA